MLMTISPEHVAVTYDNAARIIEAALPAYRFNRLEGDNALLQRLAWNQLSEHCRALADPNVFATILAAFLVVGIVFSYVPQHLKIYRRRSSEGLSAWWVLLGGVSSIAAIGNILVLPTSREDMRCCKELTAGSCAAALLGLVQIGSQWCCFMVIIVLYLIFFPDTVAAAEDISASTVTLTNSSIPANSRRDPLLVGLANFITLFVVAIVSVATVSVFPHHTQTWADILGVVSGSLAAVQYVPQIWHTAKAKTMKSLSITTLVFQAPGAFLFALSLGLRVGTEGWSTWIVYIITGSLQFVLLALALLFWMRDRSASAAAGDHSAQSAASSAGMVDQPPGRSDHPAERTPLLAKSDRRSEATQVPPN